MPEQTPAGETEVGVITHYWSHLGVAGVHLTAPLDVGDRIHVIGHTSNFEQDLNSMQIEHNSVSHADEGDDVGIALVEHAREHDKIYKSVAPGEVAASESEL